MRGLPPVLLAALLLAGCAAPFAPGATTASDAAGRAPASAWTANLSDPRYEGVDSSLARVEADDGAGLSLTLHLPAGLPEGERVPTLLQITPYQPVALRTSTPLGTDGPGPEWRPFVERGAAYVEADARGTGGSDGCLDFGGSADRADAAALVRWIRAQAWSNGVVVTDGVSHPGMGSVVAHAAVPDLAAALAHAPVVSYYQDEWYQGAKFDSQFNGPGYQAIELAPPLYADPASAAAQAAPCTGGTLLGFHAPDGRWTDVWEDRHLARHAQDARAPILLTQGFVDVNVHPDHVQFYWDALPDDAPKWVIWGWWDHGWPDMAGHPAGSFEAVRHRWLDAALFGLGNGAWDEPRVLVEDSTGAWHEGERWPLEPSEEVVLFAAPGGALSNATPAEGGVAYEDRLDALRGRWTGASAVFRGEPLAERRLVNGAPVVELAASSSEAATKWVAYLLDEAPDGAWDRVSHGYADSHVWAGEREWRDLTPGAARDWTIRLMPTAFVIEPGHRLVLVVASQDSSLQAVPGQTTPCFDDRQGGCYNPSGIEPAQTAGRAVNEVLTGPEGTRVRLAWVDPALTAKPQ